MVKPGTIKVSRSEEITLVTLVEEIFLVEVLFYDNASTTQDFQLIVKIEP